MNTQEYSSCLTMLAALQNQVIALQTRMAALEAKVGAQ